MAHFIKVLRRSGETLALNFDYVVQMKPNGDETLLILADGSRVAVDMPLDALSDRVNRATKAD